MSASDFLARLWEKRVALLVTFAVFLIVAQVSAHLYRGIGASSSVILSPAGVGLAAVIIEGYLIWPAIALAVLANGLINGSPLLLILASMLGNVLQPLLIYYILSTINFDRMLTRLKDMMSLTILAIFGTMILPTINAAAVYVNNYLYDPDRPIMWTSWWLGGAVSAMVITPFLIRWVRRTMTPRTQQQLLEATIAISFLTLVSYFLFATQYSSVFGISLLIVLIVPLFWLAFRCGPRFMTLALLIMTFLSFWGAVYGIHPPATGASATLAGRIYATQVFDIFLAFFFFILVSLEEQRKEAVKRVNERNLKLEKAVEAINSETNAKNEFIATLAHELRNPLAPLMTSVELLRLNQPDPEEYKKRLDLMHQQISTMGYLLDDLLDISRITQRKLTLKKAMTSLEQLVRRAVEVTTPMIMQYKHALTVTLPGVPVTVEVDSLRLEQVLINLLHNAAKYTPPGGKISLTADYHDGILTLTVCDTGVGISPEMMDRIFEPFVQVRDPRVQRGGIGIGLSLTKNLVELHGGTISVAAGPGKVGTEFTIKIPVKAGPISSGEADIRSFPSVVNEPLSILVADDNQSAADSLARLLATRGHNASVALSGNDVFESVANNVPEVIILDIGMPDMNGYEVAEHLRANKVPSVLIALTGFGQDEDVERAKKAGFDYHLTKPVGLAKLEPVLKEAARKRPQKAR